MHNPSKQKSKKWIENYHAYKIAHFIERIIVPEANNLVITVHRDNLYIWDNFQKDDCQTVKEIDIPDELVKKAVEFMKAKNDLLPQFKKLIKENS